MKSVFEETDEVTEESLSPCDPKPLLLHHTPLPSSFISTYDLVHPIQPR